MYIDMLLSELIMNIIWTRFSRDMEWASQILTLILLLPQWGLHVIWSHLLRSPTYAQPGRTLPVTSACRSIRPRDHSCFFAHVLIPQESLCIITTAMLMYALITFHLLRPFPISPIFWLIIMANTWRISAVPHRLTLVLFMHYFMRLLVFSEGGNMSHSLALHFLVCEMNPWAGEEQGWDPNSLSPTAEMASYGYCLIEVIPWSKSLFSVWSG